MAIAFLFLSLAELALVLNVWFPRFSPPRLAMLSFFAGWLTGELPLHHVAALGLCAAAFVAAGALSSPLGALALALAALAVVGLLATALDARRAKAAIEAALVEGLGVRGHRVSGVFDAPRAAFGPRQLLAPIPVRHPGVRRTKDVVYYESSTQSQRLDVYQPGAPVRQAPVLLFVHGGGWVIGAKDHHGLPLMQHLASLGWVCFGISYRLSPRATHPDHIIDVKRAIAWAREHAADYGGDGSRIVLVGGSAGAHLAALAALTPNAPEFQPGFEVRDTRVCACVGLYGIYDLADRRGTFPHGGLRRLLERRVVKRPLAEARDLYDSASPVCRVHAAAPPFMLVHGQLDSVVPVAQSRQFAEALRGASESPVVFAEVPGAQHVFELFPSLRGRHAVEGVARFCAWVAARELHRDAD